MELVSCLYSLNFTGYFSQRRMGIYNGAHYHLTCPVAQIDVFVMSVTSGIPDRRLPRTLLPCRPQKGVHVTQKGQVTSDG